MGDTIGPGEVTVAAGLRRPSAICDKSDSVIKAICDKSDSVGTRESLVTCRSVAVENAKSRDKPRTTRRLPTAWHTYLALPVQRDQSGLIGTPSYNSKQVKR